VDAVAANALVLTGFDGVLRGFLVDQNVGVNHRPGLEVLTRGVDPGGNDFDGFVIEE
jgi:hypothetical protein